MLGKIIELIEITKPKGKYSDIARGKNKLPETFSELYSQIKKTIKNG